MKHTSSTKALVVVGSVVAVGLAIVGLLRVAAPPIAFASYAPNISTTGYAAPGDTITVLGGGWPAQHTLTITYDGQQVATALVNYQESIVGQPTGAFRAPVTLPTTTTLGAHTIQVTDTSTGLTQQITVTLKAEWNQFGFTAAGARYNPYETAIGPANVNQLTLDWSATTGYTGPVMPTVAEDDLLLSNQAAHYLTNLNATSGQQIWQDYPISAQSQPAVANGLVYVGDYYFKALNIETGAVVWQSPYLLYDGSPVLANGLVYATSGDNGGTLDAFAASGCGALTCDPLWSYTPPGGFNGTPAVAGGHVYIVGSQLTVLNAATGALQWTGPITSGQVVTATIVDNGEVYFVGNHTYSGGTLGDGTLYAYNAAGCGQSTCSAVWTADNPSGWGYSPAAANGVVYIGGKDKALYAFAESGCGAASCSPVWKGAADGQVLSPPAVANGVVYVASWYPGAAQAFNATGCGSATCAPLWTYRLGSSDVYLDAPLTIANGLLYFSDDSGVLRVFDLPNTPARCHGASQRPGPHVVCAGASTAR